MSCFMKHIHNILSHAEEYGVWAYCTSYEYTLA